MQSHSLTLAMLVCLLSLLTLARSHHSISDARRGSMTAERGGRCIKKTCGPRLHDLSVAWPLNQSLMV